ncbi:nitroreductase family protein [Oscillochloris sp. ZM17-4]|uniref:nitroreductase family protein n=1 Tax=Oscillochloris sp. ZM17-4 TaxID=2866714 RepID=UPI001C72D46F|nr:nitroreductase family protein [Oscillochloris sp. ZM17-4]MBX0329538.1 nitroreductase family protein [Oscillochloris sp. ZM17-4]
MEDHIPLDFQPIPPEESLARAEAFYAQMARRRSVRFFADRPLPEGLLEQIVATAGTAPSGANQQPWTFVAVRSPDLKRQIRAAAEEEERAFYSQRAPESWLSDLAPLGTGWEKPFLDAAPALLVIFRQRHGYDADGTLHKHYYTLESVGIAVGMLIAAIHNAGLVSLTHTPSPMEFLERILERPTSEKAFLLMPVGYPAEDATVPNITRKPLDEILIWR